MPVSVLVVDDSASARHLMTQILTSDGDIEVLATAEDGESALISLDKLRPDVITLDLNLPGISGLEVTRRIMQTAPLPIVIVTSDKKCTANPFVLLEAGAVAVLPRPAPIGAPGYEDNSAQLIRTIKALSGVKLVRRTAKPSRSESVGTVETGITGRAEFECVAMGASTGGPQVLKQILSGLPANFPMPVVVTQHMASGFLPGLVSWLDEGSALQVVLATNGQRLQPGHVYVAPDDRHLGFSQPGVAVLSKESNRYGVRPSVSYMFNSLEEAYGSRCVAILLTGMGRDGATELASLRTAGALTIAQDRESSLIHGMPGEAIACGGACEVLSPAKIIARLLIAANCANNSAVSGL